MRSLREKVVREEKGVINTATASSSPFRIKAEGKKSH